MTVIDKSGDGDGAGRNQFSMSQQQHGEDDKGEEMSPLELGPSRFTEVKVEKKAWSPSRHMEWVSQRIVASRLTPYPVTAVLNLEFVPDDPKAPMRQGWLDEARRTVVAALDSPVTVVLDGQYHVAVSLKFVRQNRKSHHFVTTSGWADPFKQAFVSAALGSAEKALRDNGLNLRVSFVLTKPMGSFFIERSSLLPLEQPASPPTSPPADPATQY